MKTTRPPKPSAAAPATLGSLAPNELNPRTISRTDAERLRASLLEFGDLSGFVFNRRTGKLVGAHQRRGVLPAESPIVITDRFDAPNTQGTVARDYIEIAGERHTYREVDWPEKRERAAMIAANKFGQLATWNDPALAKLLQDLDQSDRNASGFATAELDTLLRTLGQAGDTTLTPLPIPDPPKMLWVLIGLPITRLAEIQPQLDALALIDGIFLETAANDQTPKPEKP